MLVLLGGVVMQGVRIRSRIAMAMVLKILLALILRDNSGYFKAPMVAKVVGPMACAKEVIYLPKE